MAGSRHDDPIRGASDWPRAGCVPVEPKMRSGVQVVIQVGVQDAGRPPRAADDHVIEPLTANGPDESLDLRVLPRGVRAARTSRISMAIAVFNQAMNP